MRTNVIQACLRASMLLFFLNSPNMAFALDSTTPPGAQDSQGNLKQLSLEQLGNIEVSTASKSPEHVWDTPAAIYVITQEDIKRSGATTIPDALRLAPGVEVARIDANKWSIGIRGFGSRLSRSVLVLMDGRSVYSTLLTGTYWEVQDTVMEDIDRIEVIRGPGGTIWGPNAVNGVINIITKKSKDTQGLLVSAGGGNFEQGFISARYGGSNGKGLDYRIYGKGFVRGPEYHFDAQNYDRWRAAQSGFRLDWKKNERDSFTFQGDIYDEGAGETVNLTNYTPPYTQTVTGTEYLSGGNILGRWTRTFSEDNDVQLQVYYDRTNRREPNFGDLRNTFDVDYLQRFHLGSRHHISFGLGARASQGHELEITPGLYFSPAFRTDQLYTAFIQDKITLIPNRLAAEIGTKLVLTNYTNVEPEPSGRLIWTPTDTETFWAAVTRAVRTPSDAERDFFLSGFINIQPDGTPFFARFNGNPNFKSELLNGYELGFRRLIGKSLYVDVAGFFNQYNNLFSEDIIGARFLENVPPPPHLLLPAEFGNGLEGSTIGGEIVPEWKPASFWTLKGSYSFLHMVLKKNPGSLDIGSAPGIVGASPQNQVMTQSSLDLPKRVTFDLTFRYVSALPAFAIHAYSTADARLGWKVGNHLELSAVGSNLFQPYHVEYASDPGPNVAIRRNVYGKIVWRSSGN
ncbi:MAG TPA: TonB-dependent receptor [Candidatus Saccharimonadales bacterium]|jgi:iron complex outermembrane receptor protein|nr:TonB-dependent receptor [Candidatus Saccharimonadales bacterium]